MNGLPSQAGTEYSRLRLLLSLSRTPHLLLDLATPSLAALLCLAAFPPAGVVVLGLLTAFSGYSAVYALNDLIDHRLDCLALSSVPADRDSDLDGLLVRHPLAQGWLGRTEALLWIGAWSVAALVGSYLLNPLCTLIFLLAALLEVIYCRLFQVTWLRCVISGLVKTSGPLAAILAVTPHPPVPLLLTLFLWLFFWELGGQNLPNDLADWETDQRLGAQTLAVRFGPGFAVGIINVALLLCAALSLALLVLLPTRPALWYGVGALFSGFYFLLLPCYRLCRSTTRHTALDLFNRASVYPLSLLVLTTLDRLT